MSTAGRYEHTPGQVWVMAKHAPAPRRPRGIGRLTGVSMAVVAVTATLFSPSGVALPADDFSGTRFAGEAHGATTDLEAGGVSATLGKVAHQILRCNPDLNDGAVNEVATVDLTLPSTGRPIIHAENVRNAGTTTAATDGADATETATAENVRLLDGLITAEVVEARSHSRLDASGINHHSTIDEYPGGDDGSTGTTLTEAELLGLIIDGTPLPSNPEPNTEVSLGPVGRLVLNEQRLLAPIVTDPLGQNVHAGISVTAMHVYVDDFEGFSGDIVVGHAETIVIPAPGQLSGFAFAVNVIAPPVVRTGNQAIKWLACAGSGGTDQTLVQAGLHVPGVSGSGVATLAETATLTSTVNGSIDSSAARSTSSETIEDLSLFDGRIAADAITTVAETTSTGGGVSSDSDVRFMSLFIDGDEFAVDVPQFTEVPLPGLGTVVLNHHWCESDTPDDPGTPWDDSRSCDGMHYNQITATAIVVRITVPDNAAGLPVGAVIRVARAHSDVRF